MQPQDSEPEAPPESGYAAVLHIGDQEFAAKLLNIAPAEVKPFEPAFRYRMPAAEATFRVHVTAEDMRRIGRLLDLPPRPPHTKRQRLHGGRLPKRSQRRRT